VLIATLWQRTSDKGNEYLSGFLGKDSRHRLPRRAQARRRPDLGSLPHPRQRAGGTR
jgi:hypothetical protein